MVYARIITDLSFGDAGKGTIVDYLARQASTVVIRYNGGPQAAHNVVTTGGAHHTFAQFGSGSLVSGVATHLSRDMLINPYNMYPEAEHLIALGQRDIWQRLSIDSEAKVITPWHKMLNMLRERARGGQRHGTCLQGVGELMADTIDRPDLTLRVGELSRPQLLARLKEIRAYKCEQAGEYDKYLDDTIHAVLTSDEVIRGVADCFADFAARIRIVSSDYLSVLAQRYDQLLFEGAQGVLLDEWYGFHPYTTWSTTTPENALRQLDEIGFAEPIETIGLVRAYTTRHGPGPFVTEDSRLAEPLREYHNATNGGQGAFRYGHFDAVMHRYAIAASRGIDTLAVTGLDRAAQLPSWWCCRRYEVAERADERFFAHDNVTAQTTVRLGRREDLGYQQQLGEALSRVSPLYQQYEQLSERDIAAQIEAALETPVRIASCGPTAADKFVLP